MKKTLVIFLLIIAGCKTPAHKPSPTQFDTAIENLSITTQQLDSLQKEKDLFVKALEDFERQKAEYGRLLNPDILSIQNQFFTDWHRDITLRERDLEFKHALNVFTAHSEAMKHKSPEPNHIPFAESNR